MIERLINLVLDNIGITIFLVFMVSGLLGRGDKKKAKPQDGPMQGMPKNPAEADGRPLAERMAEYFGVEIPDQQPAEKPQPAAKSKTTYASDGRRSTSQRTVQEDYPDLFGGPGLFADKRDGSAPESETKWGFDDAEWGSSFEKNEEEWGSAFADKKDSAPRVEWPT